MAKRIIALELNADLWSARGLARAILGAAALIDENSEVCIQRSRPLD